MGSFLLGKHEAKLGASVEEAKTEEDNPGKKEVKNHRKKEDEDEDKKERNDQDDKSQCCARTKWLAGLAWLGFKLLAFVVIGLWVCLAFFAVIVGPILCEYFEYCQ